MYLSDVEKILKEKNIEIDVPIEYLPIADDYTRSIIYNFIVSAEKLSCGFVKCVFEAPGKEQLWIYGDELGMLQACLTDLNGEIFYGNGKQLQMNRVFFSHQAVYFFIQDVIKYYEDKIKY